MSWSTLVWSQTVNASRDATYNLDAVSKADLNYIGFVMVAIFCESEFQCFIVLDRHEEL